MQHCSPGLARGPSGSTSADIRFVHATSSRSAPGWTSRLLDGENPDDYLRSLNDHAFLFPSAARGLKVLKSKYSGDGLMFELDTEAVLTDVTLASRIRLVDHNPGAVSFNPSVRHLSRSKWHTIERGTRLIREASSQPRS